MSKDCDLNDGGVLRSSNANLTGIAAGDGNKPSIEDLRQGFTKLPDPTTPFHRLPGDDTGMDLFVQRGGFAGRPQGWEQ